MSEDDSMDIRREPQTIRLRLPMEVLRLLEGGGRESTDPRAKFAILSSHGNGNDFGQYLTIGDVATVGRATISFERDNMGGVIIIVTV